MEMDAMTGWFEKTVTEWAPIESSYDDVKAMDKELVDVMVTVSAIVGGKISDDPYSTIASGVFGKAYVEKCWNAFIRKYARTQVEKDFHLGVPKEYEDKIKYSIHGVIGYLKERGFCLVTLKEAFDDAKAVFQNDKNTGDKTPTEIPDDEEFKAQLLIGCRPDDTLLVLVHGCKQTLIESLATVMKENQDFKETVELAIQVADLALKETDATC